MSNPNSNAQEQIALSAQYQNVGEVTKRFATRTAETQASFLLPYLSSGMRLLDCGCGPGTITVDLARIVFPGEVVGIDVDLRRIEAARAHAREQQVANVQFDVADVYTLAYEDNTFDAVFSNAVLHHLADPLAALIEMQRVLKGGG